MPKLTDQSKAPDFVLTDTQAQTIRLSDVTAKSPVVLVLTRGFA